MPDKNVTLWFLALVLLVLGGPALLIWVGGGYALFGFFLYALELLALLIFMISRSPTLAWIAILFGLSS